jgi:hypothetical protein
MTSAWRANDPPDHRQSAAPWPVRRRQARAPSCSGWHCSRIAAARASPPSPLRSRLGFFAGLWHGWIIFFSFVGSLSWTASHLRVPNNAAGTIRLRSWRWRVLGWSSEQSSSMTATNILFVVLGTLSALSERRC